jgi:hypothetical protein
MTFKKSVVERGIIMIHPGYVRFTEKSRNSFKMEGLFSKEDKGGI